MFGSDWPVALLATSSYSEVVRLAQSLTVKFTERENEWVPWNRALALITDLTTKDGVSSPSRSDHVPHRLSPKVKDEQGILSQRPYPLCVHSASLGSVRKQELNVIHGPSHDGDASGLLDGGLPCRLFGA